MINAIPTEAGLGEGFYIVIALIDDQVAIAKIASNGIVLKVPCSTRKLSLSIIFFARSTLTINTADDV